MEGDKLWTCSTQMSTEHPNTSSRRKPNVESGVLHGNLDRKSRLGTISVETVFETMGE